MIRNPIHILFICTVVLAACQKQAEVPLMSTENSHPIVVVSSSVSSSLSFSSSSSSIKPIVKPLGKILYDATHAMQYWVDRRTSSGGMTVNWLDTTQALPTTDSVDLLRLNGKLNATVQHISSLIIKEHMTINTEGGEIIDGKITNWTTMKTTALQKPLEAYLEDTLHSNLQFLLIGHVLEGNYAKSDVYFMTAGCFRDDADTFACDTSYHMVLVTSDHRFLRLVQYSDTDSDIGALDFLEKSDARVLNAFSPPVIAVPNSQIPLVNIAVSRDRAAVSNSYEAPLTSVFKDPITGVEMFTQGDDCCTARNNNGTWSVYQFDFDQMALRAQSREEILSGPSLSTGILYFTKNDGTLNQDGYTHNSTASCGGEVPSYELRLAKPSDDELTKGYERIGTIADNVPVYRDKLTQQQIDQPSENEWLYSFYLRRFPYEDYRADWKEFYNSIPVVWIPDPLGGFVGFVNSNYPFPAECEGRSSFNGPQW